MSSVTSPPRQPRGWDQLVGQLNSAADRPAFLRGVLELQCRIVAGDYGAVWDLNEQGQPRLIAAWQVSLSSEQADNPIYKLLEQAARLTFQRNFSQVIAVQTQAQPGQPGQASQPTGQIFATAFKIGSQSQAVSTVVSDVRDPQVIQSTAPMRELAAGLFEGYVAREHAQVQTQENQRIRQALSLLGLVQEAQGFAGATLNLVNELARQLGCERVSLGWVHSRSIRLTAMSDTEQLKRHSEPAAMLEMAMAECLDQQQPLVYPVPADAEPLLSQAVVYSHRKLAGTQSDRHLLSIPLRHRDQWVGVLTFEHHQPVFDVGTIERLQLTADVVAPQLADRKESDRWLVGHAWRSVRWAGAFMVGPKHVGWKLLGLSAAVLLLVVLLGSWPYQVTSGFRLEAMQRRIVATPYGGKLASVKVKPNDQIQVGQVLAELDSTELRLQLIEAQSRLRQAQVEYDQMMAQGKLAQAQMASATKRETQARIDLLEHQIQQAVLRSPIAGVLLTGYWHDKVGGVVEQGTNMFEIAPQGQLTVVMRVGEADINQLIKAGAQQSVLKGELATRAEPAVTFPLKVQRIVPLARPHEGANVFEVWCDLDQESDWLRAGMEGIASVDVGRRPIAWILTHRLVDAVRLWMWW